MDTLAVEVVVVAVMEVAVAGVLSVLAAAVAVVALTCTSHITVSPTNLAPCRTLPPLGTDLRSSRSATHTSTICFFVRVSNCVFCNVCHVCVLCACP